MKVLQINKYHYLRGGSDKVYLLTSQLLSKNGHEVIHFSTKNDQNLYSPTSHYFVSDPNYLQQPKLKQIKSSWDYIYSNKAKAKLEQLINDEKPDIAHLHIFFGEISLSILPVLKKYHIPTVMTLHDFKFMCPVYSFMNSKNEICEKCGKGNYLHAVINRCNKGSLAFSAVAAMENIIRDRFFPYEKYIDHFIAVSQFSAEKHLEYRAGIKQKISVVPNYTDIPPNNTYGNHNDFYLFFGRLTLQKGIHNLLKAFELLPQAQLKIVGEGPEKEHLIDYCTQKKLANVQFLGYKSGGELYALIEKAKFTMMPSIGYESFGLSLIESMRLGTPVMAATLGGMKELIREDKNGFFINTSDVRQIRDTILKGMQLEEESYFAMSKNSVEFSLNFSEESYYNKLMKVYNLILTQ